MLKYLISYGAAFLTLVAIDAIWLRLVMLPLYQKNLRHLLADDFIIWPVIAFYLVYTAGICFFVILPALNRDSSIIAVLGTGFFLGLVVYSAYDFTNIATLRNWPVATALLDMVWGATLTAIASALSFWLTKIIAR